MTLAAGAASVAGGASAFVEGLDDPAGHADIDLCADHGQLSLRRHLVLLADDRGGPREVYAEAKGEGYDTKVMRKLTALRKKDPHQRREEAELLELYLAAIGE